MTDTAVRRHDGLNWHAFAHVDCFSPEQCAFADRQVADSIAWYRPALRKQQRQGHGADYQAMLASSLRTTGDPEDGIAEADGNLLVNNGLTAITGLICFTTSAAGQAFGPTAKAGVGVGATTTAATVTDTVLGSNGASAFYQVVDASFPTTSVGVMTAQSTFASGNANFAWQEWCWFTATVAITVPGASLTNALSGGSGSVAMWNHKIASLGTKASGAAWVFTTTITLS